MPPDTEQRIAKIRAEWDLDGDDVDDATGGLMNDISILFQKIDSIPDQIARAVEAEPEKQWQPIETAPKDGTHILVCSAHQPSRRERRARSMQGERSTMPLAVVCYQIDPTEPDFDGFHAVGGDAERPYPATHWMPLPIPPAILKRGKKP